MNTTYNTYMSQQVASKNNDIGSIAVGLRPNASEEKRAMQPYFVLKLFIADDVDNSVRDLYVSAVDKHNAVMNKCIYDDISAEFDAGFDLFVPVEEVIQSNTLGYKMNHMIKCSMNRSVYAYGSPSSEKPVGYYLYPRSSTGTKTPLRLSNSVGIIDSGYRGNIIAAFDNRDTMSNSSGFKVERGSRVVQICPPELSYPVLVEIVENESDLGTTNRGEGGFGSTGN